jgi:hypothetical protein
MGWGNEMEIQLLLVTKKILFYKLLLLLQGISIMFTHSSFNVNGVVGRTASYFGGPRFES